MNAQSILNRVNRRLPGYDPNELLDEINDAYQEVWDYILQLDDSYFTDVQTSIVTTESAEFDFLYNSNGALQNTITSRYFQIDRIRILQGGGSNWIPAMPRSWNDPEYLALNQSVPATVSTASPYRYVPFANGIVQFAQPLPVGTTIELVYTFTFLPLSIVSAGNIQTSSQTVTGTNTTFLSLLPPDYGDSFPGNDEDTDIGIELMVTGGPNQVYRVTKILTDTSLETLTGVIPALTTPTAYSLAMVPDIPLGHHDVLATVATRNVMARPGTDPQLPYWVARAERDLSRMRDSIMSRQRQEPPRRRRFIQSVLRYFVPSVGR